MKKFCVTYSYRTLFDAVVTARNKKEAEMKVLEIIGDCDIEKSWEIKDDEDSDKAS